jgi:hypothetical protein
MQLKIVKNVQLLARDQLFITYAALVEEFVNDILRNYFLKSHKVRNKPNRF